MGIAKIQDLNNGKKFVEFYQLEILEILKNLYGFRYAQIGRKKYFLRKNQSGYSIVKFADLRRTFANLIREDFEGLKILNKENETVSIIGKIEYFNFINEYHNQKPIKLNCAREVLSEDFYLTEEELHALKLQIIS